MSWDQQSGNKKLNRTPLLYGAAVLVVIALLGGLVLLNQWGNSDDRTTTVDEFSDPATPRGDRSQYGTQAGPNDPIPTLPKPPYVPPPTIVAAPVVRVEQLPPGAPMGVEGRVGEPEQLARQYNVNTSRLSPQLYQEISNRSTDIVASMLRRDLAQRYPTFFVSSPTMRNWTIDFATAMVPELRTAQGRYYRGVVYWRGTPSSGIPILQATTAIYFKQGNLEPVDPRDLDVNIPSSDPAVRTTYVTPND